jgi:hypothetical protein
LRGKRTSPLAAKVKKSVVPNIPHTPARVSTITKGLTATKEGRFSRPRNDCFPWRQVFQLANAGRQAETLAATRYRRGPRGLSLTRLDRESSRECSFRAEKAENRRRELTGLQDLDVGMPPQIGAGRGRRMPNRRHFHIVS